MSPTPKAPLDARARWMRIDGDRRLALATLLSTPEGAALPAEPAFAFGFVPEEARAGVSATWLGAAPFVVRPLRPAIALAGLGVPAGLASALPRVPLTSPLGGRARPGVRAITSHDPRMTRLWERFSVDVGVAVERSAAFLGARAFEGSGPPRRVLVLEDGERYAIRAMCMFTEEPAALTPGGAEVGIVHELLHDRSVTGMRAASHLLGLAVHEMARAGADAAVALSFAHSGSFPMFVRHGFLPSAALARAAAIGASPLAFGVAPEDPELAPIVVRPENWHLSWLDVEDALAG